MIAWPFLLLLLYGLLTILYFLLVNVYHISLGQESVTSSHSPTPFDPASNQLLFCQTNPPARNLSFYDQFTSCRQITEFSCMEVLRGNPEAALFKAKNWTIPSSWIITPQTILETFEDCRTLLRWLALPKQAFSREDFPLAFVCLTHSVFNQFVRLFRMVYMPQNAYCIHIDSMCSNSYRRAVSKLASCLPNVVVGNRSVRVPWGGKGYLIAANTCLEQLNSMRTHKWKYVQFITDNDIPLRTNREMVDALGIFGGANDVQLMSMQPYRNRIESSWKVSNNGWQRLGRKEKPPLNLQIYKGTFATALSRAFVNFTLHAQSARALYDWINDTLFPEETFWPTLNHNLGLNAPGNFPELCLSRSNNSGWSKQAISRYQVWQSTAGETFINYSCHGAWKRYSCLFGVGDLQRMLIQHKFVAHKFQDDFEPAAQYCLGELHCNRTRCFCNNRENRSDELIVPLNLTSIHRLSAVVYHKMKNKTDYNCPLE